MTPNFSSRLFLGSIGFLFLVTSYIAKAATPSPDLTRPETPEQAAAQINPSRKLFIRQVAVDPATGDVAVLTAGQDEYHIALYSPEGRQLQRFRPVAGAQRIAWLPDSTLLVAASFPSTNAAPYIYSLEGKEVGRFGEKSNALQFFNYKGNGVGLFIAAGSMLADKKGAVYMSAPMADEDAIPLAEIEQDSTKRHDHGIGARIHVYDLKGNLVRTIGNGWGAEPGQMKRPMIMSFNEDCSLIAVDNQNGIDVFDVSSGAFKKRIPGFHLLAQATGPFLIVQVKDQVGQIDFDGKVIKTYPSIPLGNPLRKNYFGLAYGGVDNDGSLYLPSGIGYTYFQKFSPDGQLVMSRGDAFDYLSVKVAQVRLTQGQPAPIEIQATDADHYYAMTPHPQPTFRGWMKSLLGDAEWRSVAIRPATPDKNDDHYLVDIPPDAVGPQALRVSSSDILSDDSPEIQFLVPSGAKGSATLFTQQNRQNFQAGEEIKVHLVVQSSVALDQDIPVALIDSKTGKAVASGQVHVSTRDSAMPCSIHLTLPSSSTKLLATGDYVLTANVEGLKSYPATLSIVSNVPATKAFLSLLHDWDLAMPNNDWKYPNLGEYSAWLGFNSVWQWRQSDQALATKVLPSISKSLSLDIGYPAPEKGFKANDWAEFLDRGLKTETNFMPTMGTWEGYRVVRDEDTLAQDTQKIHVMAQSLGLYPNFKGLDYNITNFFNFDVPVGPKLAEQFKTATGLDMPTNDAIKAVREGRSTQDLSAALTAYSKFETSIYLKDYTAWGQALHDIKPDALGMATMVGAKESSWPPALEGRLDILQSHMQCEQVLPVYSIMVNGFWAARPGKPHVSDFEDFNESGTGERMDAEAGMSMLTGSWPGVDTPPAGGEGDMDKTANTLRGAPYVHREFFRRQTLITDLLSTDRVATPIGILITKSQSGLDSKTTGVGVGNNTWKRFYSACVLCQMAHRPARALFGDDLAAGKTFDGMKAILLVGQTQPLSPEESSALSAFQSRGGIVILDADCTVSIPSARQLSVSTFALEQFGMGGQRAIWSTDGSWLTVPQNLLSLLPKFTADLDKILPAVVYPDRPEVFITAYDGGDANYLVLVNSRRPPIPGMDYSKVSARFASVMPLITRVKVLDGTKFVYDVMSRTWLPMENGSVAVDLRSHANTVIACLTIKPRLKLSLPASVKSGEKLTCTVQAMDENNNSIKAAIPFIVDLRADDGRLLARRISCTGNQGTFTLDMTAPAAISGIKASIVCAIGGETDTAQSVVVAAAQPQLAQETVLSSNLSHLLDSLKAADSIVLADKGDAVLDQAITEHFAAAGLKVQSPATTPVPMDKHRVVIVTGGKDLNLFWHGNYTADFFPVTLSDNVPGANNAFLGLALSPANPREDMLVAIAPDEPGRQRLLAALDDVLKGKPAPAATSLAPTTAMVPALEMPAIPDTALERFRADTIAERLLDPKAVWESRLKSATARIGSLTLSSDGKTLFAGALNWDTNLYALDAATGKVRWTRHAGQNYVPHVWAGANGAVFAHILTTDDASHQAELFDENGTPQRRFAAPGVTLEPNGNFYRIAYSSYGWSLAVSPDGQTVIGAGNVGIAAWDATTGAELWHKNTDSEITEVATQPAARIAISPNGKTVAILYCTDSRGGNNLFTPRLEVCETASGRVVWSYQPEPFDQVMAMTPVWSSESSSLLIGHAKGAWELQAGKVVRQFAVWPGTYRPGSQELFDGKTLLDSQGHGKWDLDLIGCPIEWAWSPTGNEVAVSTDLGVLECHDKDGKLLWRTQTHGAVALTIRDGDLYAADWSGLVYRYDIHTGHELWQSDAATARVVAPLVEDDAYAKPPAVPLVAYWPATRNDPRPAGNNIALADQGAKIKLCGQASWGSTGRVQVNPLSLIDASLPQEELPWQTPEETWSQLVFAIAPQAQITFPGEVKNITGLVVHENPGHPESFPKIAVVEAHIDGKWEQVWQGLLNPGAEHNHVFDKPVIADGIRYTPIGCTLNGVYAQSIEVLSQP